MRWFDNTALTLVIIGAVNWLLIGIFQFDLVAYLLGNLSWFSRIIYTLVGLCGLYLITLFGTGFTAKYSHTVRHCHCTERIVISWFPNLCAHLARRIRYRSVI